MAFLGVFYVAFMLSYLYQVRAMIDGRYLVWLIFLSSWGSDTSAYCVGNLIGKRKLAPVLSPHKSIEGAIGGVIGSSLFGLLYATFFGKYMTELNNPQAVCALACAIASVISQVGDLAASAIKRNHKVKDYGKLIPGHGGILDRFDSMIFTAPAIYFAITFLS
jgi:phosphatidate cytidylyltransferase